MRHKKITVDCSTGEVQEVEMRGDELAAHKAMLAVPDDLGATTERTRARSLELVDKFKSGEYETADVQEALVLILGGGE